MRTLELFFNDLTPEAQTKYLKVQGVSDASELNWEVNPVAFIEVEEEDPDVEYRGADYGKDDEGFCGDDPSIIKGSFTSVWDSGSVQTEGTLNTRTGEVTAETANLSELGSLDREYFTDKTGKEYEICPECHQFILRTVMVPDKTGKGLHEEQVCAGICDPQE